VAFIKATKHHHQTSIRSNITNWARQLWLFRTFIVKKSSSWHVDP
jgi:hypothetical protein